METEQEALPATTAAAAAAPQNTATDTDTKDETLPPLIPEDSDVEDDDSDVEGGAEEARENGGAPARAVTPTQTPSPEPPVSLMEWNWNPVRLFVSRLQNLSAMRPPAPSFDFLPKLSAMSLPSFNFGWWGGHHAAAPPSSEGETKESETHGRAETEQRAAPGGAAAGTGTKKQGGIFSFRGFFGYQSDKEDEEGGNGSRKQTSQRKNDSKDEEDDEEEDEDDDDSSYMSSDSSASDDDGDDDDDDDLFLFGNMPVNPRMPSRNSKSRLFMDKYTRKQIWTIFREKRFKVGKRAGQTFEEVFRSKGIDCLALDVDTSDPFVHKLNVYGAPSEELRRNNELEARRKKEHLLAVRASKGLGELCPSGDDDDDDDDSDDDDYSNDDDDDDDDGSKQGKRAKLKPPFTPQNLLVQFFVRRDTSFSVMETKSFTTTESGVPAYYANAFNEGIKHLRGYFGQKRLQMLVIEWLRLQNPRQSFGERMPLPGQMHPGLGIGSEIDSVLVGLATDSHRDGILNLPEHWYNAYLYTKSSKPYKFMNPAFQGFFQSICDALEDDIRTRGLPTVAWAIFRGLLRCRPVRADASFVPPFITNTFAAFVNDSASKPAGTAAAAVPAAAAASPSSSSSAAAAAAEHKTTAAATADEAIKWVSQEQVCPLSWQMSYYFASPSYSNVVRRYYHPEAFYILWDDTASIAQPVTVPAPAPDQPPQPRVSGDT